MLIFCGFMVVPVHLLIVITLPSEVHISVRDLWYGRHQNLVFVITYICFLKIYYHGLLAVFLI